MEMRSNRIAWQSAEKLCGQAGILLVCTSGITGIYPAGCSKRLSSKAAASEEARRTLRYVESLREARTPLADFFSILLDLMFQDDEKSECKKWRQPP